jgi:hypothetical protein
MKRKSSSPLWVGRKSTHTHTHLADEEEEEEAMELHMESVFIFSFFREEREKYFSFPLVYVM